MELHIKKICIFAGIFQKPKNMINITFPDQSVRQYESGVTPLDIAKSLSEGLARNVLSAKVNGKMWDAMRPVNEDATINSSLGTMPKARPLSGIPPLT